MRAHWAPHLPILAALLGGALAYGIAAPSIGWVSDDYALVYGAPLKPWPGLEEAFLAGGEGHFSVHRLLCYPFLGYVGGMLGPAASHVLQVLLHLGCGWLLYALLRRLRWPATDAAWAAAGFLVVPWVSQPVYWWSSVCTIVSTIFIMVAAHAYLAWSRDGGRWLWACLGCIFVALLFYELWLGSFVLFYGLELYLRSTGSHTAKDSWGRIAWHALRRSWPVLIPYALWMVAFLAFHRAATHQPTFSLLRVPVVFLSIHLRAIHWLIDTPWGSALVHGLAAIVSVGGIAVVAALAITLRACRNQRPQLDSARASIPNLPATLLLAWSTFLAARLVFILQGGIATHTRHNYGAAMAVAIAGAALLRWMEDRCSAGGARRAVRWGAGAGLAICAVSSAGIGVHYRATSAAEEATCRQLVPVLPALPPDCMVLVVGDPTGTRGELGYFSEENGIWLERRLQAYRPGVAAFAAATVAADGDFLLIETAARTSAVTPPHRAARDQVALFRWQDRRLVSDRSGL
ncbi:MAG: hypothetical protein QOE70_5688 [Chthoniobacter sp.]|jgi:hypothetical protein|nr:hypothetical protein [Chthoniobacter sp.]